MIKKSTKNAKKGSTKSEKQEDNMKVTPEDLYKWIDYAYDRVDTSERRA